MMNHRNERLEAPSAEERIALRNNWLRIFLSVALTVLIGAKLWQTDFAQALIGFEFSDLLALLLALFSVALAVIFYLKATEASNKFYDNSYRFTREVSEILGRIEAGFGERLRHLDEGYSGLRSTFEQRLSFDRAGAEKEIEQEEEQVQKVEQERDQILEDLAGRARLQEEEKHELFTQLKRKEDELSRAREELVFLQRQLARQEDNIGEGGLSPFVIEHIKENFPKYISTSALASAPLQHVNRRFQRLTRDLPSGILHHLRRAGVIDSEMNLTRHGLILLRHILAATEHPTQ